MTISIGTWIIPGVITAICLWYLFSTKPGLSREDAIASGLFSLLVASWSWVIWLSLRLWGWI